MTKRDDLSGVRLSDWLGDTQRKSATHSGLWLEKYFPSEQNGSDKSAKANWQGAIADLPEPFIYQRFFNDVWQPLWETEKAAGRALSHPMKTSGRLVTGLGDASVLEVGLSLHHTYGVPYLPGSGLKGVAAAYADQQLGAKDPQWRRNQKPGVRLENAADEEAKKENFGAYYRTLFGDTDEAGAVDFEDALPLPADKKLKRDAARLRPDVMTVHHQDYYNAGNAPQSAPADWDSPNPVPFLSVTGTFLIVLRGPQDWCAVAWEILQAALMREGAGAKTSSGYGRMKVD